MSYMDTGGTAFAGAGLRDMFLAHVAPPACATARRFIMSQPASYLSIDGVFHAPNGDVIITAVNHLNIPVAFFIIPTEKLKLLTGVLRLLDARTRRITGKVGAADANPCIEHLVPGILQPPA